MGPLRGPGAEGSARRWRTGSKGSKGKGARLRLRLWPAGAGRLCRRGVEKGSQVGQAFGVRVETAPGGKELYCPTVQRGGKGTRFVGER